jgi:protein disulfide-isomerase A1
VGGKGGIDAASSLTSEFADVVSLTSENFHDVVKSGTWLIDFYAPWCGYCQRLEPIFEAAAKQLKKEAMPPVLQFGKVNCDEQSSLCSLYGIQGFPTLKLFRSGRYVSDYMYGRDLVDLISYGTKLSGPPVQKVTSQTLPRFKKNEVAFLLVTYDETANWDFFYEIAEKYRETAAFGITTEPEIIKDLVPTYKEATTSVIVLFNDDDDREQFIVSSANQKELLDKWIRERRYPLVSQLDLSNWRALTTGSGSKTVVAIVDPNQSDFPSFLSQFKKYARKYRGNGLIFGWLDGLKFATMTQRFEADSRQFPTIIVWDAATNSFWKHDAPFDHQSVQKFLDDVLNGRINSKQLVRLPIWQQILTLFKKALMEPKVLIIGSVTMIGFFVLIYCVVALGKLDGRSYNNASRLKQSQSPYETGPSNVTMKDDKIE